MTTEPRPAPPITWTRWVPPSPWARDKGGVTTTAGLPAAPPAATSASASLAVALAASAGVHSEHPPDDLPGENLGRQPRAGDPSFGEDVDSVAVR